MNVRHLWGKICIGGMFVKYWQILDEINGLEIGIPSLKSPSIPSPNHRAVAPAPQSRNLLLLRALARAPPSRASANPERRPHPRARAGCSAPPPLLPCLDPGWIESSTTPWPPPSSRSDPHVLLTVPPPCFSLFFSYYCC